ncbi:MAG: hypothetical protein ACPGVZ_06420 [Myxococcota bacterium]
MRISPRGKSSPYEVRCPRCDVSFPVETKTCIHCGGPTGEAGGFLEAGEPAEYRTPIEPTDYTTSTARAEPMPSSADSPLGVLREAGILRDDSRAEATNARAEAENGRAYQEDAQPPSFVQTLMRSAGSFIWVLLLIAFSLSRSCGE